MIPPALSEMRKDMLPGKLLELIEHVPEMKDREISDDEWWHEPVTPMNKIIVIKVTPDIFEREIAIIVISVMTFCQILVKSIVEVAE